MARTIISFSLPESMAIFVEERADSRVYSSVSEYLRELIRKDQKHELELMDAAVMRQNRSDPRRRERPYNADRELYEDGHRR